MNTSNNRGLTVAGLLGIAALVGLIAVFLFGVKIRTVEGNEIGVKETWSEGVLPEPLPPKTYVMFPGFNQTIYTYTTSGRVFAMNDKSETEEPFAEGRRSDALMVNSLDNQRVSFHVTITWRIDPAHVVALHKNYRDNIEERLIRPEVVNAVGIRATLQNAIDLSSGPKLNELRVVVTQELRSPTGKLAQSGVIVERFVIEKSKLNPEYEKVIESRQLAIAQESQAREQKKANESIAEAARAAALKQQYEQVVAAETAAKQQVISQQAASDKATIEAKANALNTVTTQEAAAKVVVINAKAEADRQVAISEATKQAEINRAVGIEAVGRAEAEAQKLRLQAYAVPGADAFVRVEVSKQLASAFQNVKGYLPANVNYTTVGKDFDGAVNALVGTQAAK
jgi:regulator of protease activity HflC (stomatin/prohibitin superfamily)